MQMKDVATKRGKHITNIHSISLPIIMYSRSVTMGGSCILLFLCFRDLGLYFVFEKSTKSSFYFRCFKLSRFEYKTIETADMRMQWIIWFLIFNLNLICILTNQICPRNKRSNLTTKIGSMDQFTTVPPENCGRNLGPIKSFQKYFNNLF